MKHIIQLFVTLLIIIVASCNPYKNYEEQIITQAKSIKELPVARKRLIKSFKLKSVESKISGKSINWSSLSFGYEYKGSREIWFLPNNYRLIAIDDADLKVSEEFNRKVEVWLESVTDRDYVAVEYDPIESFSEFSLVTPRGRKIYSSRDPLSQ